MKALQILIYIRRNKFIMDLLDEDSINEAIAELEELMKPKSCEGCKHHITYITSTGNIESCLIFEKDETLCVRKHRWLDRYEAKEQ